MRKLIAAAALALATIGAVSGVAGADTAVRHTALPAANYPPFWHRDTPDWCQEDMPCWLGSKADGRPDAASLADWRHQMRIAQDDLQTVWVYLPKGDTTGDPLEVGKAGITHLSRCKGHGLNETCQARLEGYSHRVFVSGVDFSHRHRFER